VSRQKGSVHARAHACTLIHSNNYSNFEFSSYQHLFGEACPRRNVFVVGNGVGALEAAGGAERPARTARTLVLDRGHLAEGLPVDVAGAGELHRRRRVHL